MLQLDGCDFQGSKLRLEIPRSELGAETRQQHLQQQQQPAHAVAPSDPCLARAMPLTAGPAGSQPGEEPVGASLPASPRQRSLPALQQQPSQAQQQAQGPSTGGFPLLVLNVGTALSKDELLSYFRCV